MKKNITLKIRETITIYLKRYNFRTHKYDAKDVRVELRVTGKGSPEIFCSDSRIKMKEFKHWIPIEKTNFPFDRKK